METSRILGGAGKNEWFDEDFTPLHDASRERWKQVDRAFRLELELPPVSVYQLGGVCLVQDGHHRVGVAHFHGVVWMDAEVTEFWSPKGQVAVPAREHSADVATSLAR